MPGNTSNPRPRVNLAEIATRLAGQRSLWEPLIAFDPVSRYYARLAAESSFEAWLLTWLPGQGTDWHDHGGSAGAFVTVQGALTERFARPDRNRIPVVEPRANLLTPGAVRAFGTRHIHPVTNTGSVPAARLHDYQPALTVMNVYAPETQTLRLAQSEQAGADW